MECGEEKRLLQSPITLKAAKEKFSILYNQTKLIHAHSYFSQDLFYLFMKMDLVLFLLSTFAIYMMLALVFSILFLPHLTFISPPITHFWKLFLFHISFLTGLGSPYTAGSVYLQLILSLESLVKVLLLSLITGLFFTRFTKPIARIRFSKIALITNHIGQRQFIFRVMHERTDALVNLHVELTVSMLEKLPESGGYWRSFHSLPLRRSGLPTFGLPWSVMHIIDRNSKLYEKTSEHLYESSAVFTVVLNASDRITGGNVHAMYYYRPPDVLFDRQFGDCLIMKPDGFRLCDMRKFDSLKEEDMV